MSNVHDNIECPFCGGAVTTFTEHQRSILRAVTFTHTVLAQCHSARHRTALLRMVHENVRRSISEVPGKDREHTLDALTHAKEAADWLDHLFRQLRDFYSPFPDRFTSLSDVPERLRSVCEIHGFDADMDFSPLTDSEHKVAFSEYCDAFSFALQGALLSLSQDRRPHLAVHFRVRENSLLTTFVLKHADRLRESSGPPSPWAALTWAVTSVGGQCDIKSQQNETSIVWDFPLRGRGELER